MSLPDGNLQSTISSRSEGAAVSAKVPAVPARVFLVGCPRSGTTLLQVLLTAHQDIASFPESHIFLKGRRLRARVAPGLVTRRNLNRFARSVKAEAPYMRRTFALRPETYQMDLIDLLDRLTREKGKRLWIEKTPNHVLSIPEIRRIAPSSRFIHLIRDGRAVVASLYEVTRSHSKRWGGAYEIERCVSEWNNAIMASGAAFESGRDGIVVDYRRLTAEPASELGRLCEFLGVQYEEGMLATYSDATRLIVSSEEEWKGRVGGPIRDDGLRKYRELFSRAQQEFIERSLIAIPSNLSPS